MRIHEFNGLLALSVILALPAAAVHAEAGTDTAAPKAQVTNNAPNPPIQAGNPNLPAKVVEPPIASGGAVGLQEIIVTANRSRSNAQRTPVAITAVTGAQLAATGVVSVSDLSKVAPGVQFTPIRDKAIPFIRGVGQGISAGNADPSVALNLNDAYVPAELSDIGFFDIDRVEVVYGPQGTLYGRNAVGGAINVITNRPGKEFGGDVEEEAGNYNSELITGGIDLPVTSDLAVRIAGRGDWHDGYFSNGESDADEWALRGTALYRPSATTSVLLIGSFSKQRGIGLGAQNAPPLTKDPWYLPYNAKSVPLFNHADPETVSLQIDQDLGALHLTSISSYAKTVQHTNFMAYLNAPSNIAFVVYDLHVRDFTQEFRLNGGGDRLKWILGLNGYYTQNGEYSAVGQQTLPSLRFVVGPWLQHAEGLAAFGQATYSLLSSLRLTVGGRYSYDTRSLGGTNVNYLNTGAPAPSPTIMYQGSRSDTRPDFKVGLEDDVRPNSLVYVNFQTGYNNGGFSTAQAVAGSSEAARFAPMTVKSWALGSKNRFFDRRIQLNGEVFYNDYDNYQVSARSLVTGQSTVYNAERAKTYGAQLDARAQPSRDDEVGLSLDLLHARFEKLIIPGSATALATNLDGYRMPLAPATTVTGDYTHHFALNNGATIDFTGDVRRVSGEWGVYNHLPGTYIRSYTMGDLTLTYVASSRHWTAGAFVRNVGDVYTTAFTLGGATPGPGTGFPMPPRTYGVRLTARF